MKKLLIASAICLLPIALLGIVNPISFLMEGNHKNINEMVLLIYIIILSVCITVVFITTISMIKYTSSIDNLEKEKSKVFERQQKLNKLIKQYNSLIESK